MILREYYKTRADGVVLVRTYSDRGMMLLREGVCYSEAIDPEQAERIYTETDIPVDQEAQDG